MLSSPLVLSLLLSAAPALDPALVRAVFPNFDPATGIVDSEDKLEPGGSATPTPLGTLVQLVTASKEGGGKKAHVSVALVDPKTGEQIAMAMVTSPGSLNYGARASFATPLPFGKRYLVPVEASFSSDGEGSQHEYSWIVVEAGNVASVLVLSDGNGGDGYPSTSDALTSKLLASKSNGLPDVAEVHKLSSCDLDPAGETKCDKSSVRKIWRFDGKRYVENLSGDPLVKGASASSMLVEKRMPKEYYSALQAVDGIAETAWVEGVKGPGTGESLTVELKKPTRVSALWIVAGCGVNEALWKKNHRLKTVKLSLDGGADRDVELKDVQAEQEIAIDPAKPVSKVKLTIGAVFKGSAYDDACISELRFTPAP